jgi:ribonuclease HI
MTEYTCKQVIIQTYASRLDLMDQPFLEPKAEWFTNGSSFVLNGERKAGYTVASHEEVNEAQPLLAGTSAQKGELIALIRALTLGEGKRLDIHTDSKYAFLVLHAYAAIWKEKGLISGRQSPIKHGKEIFQLLDAIHQRKWQ